MKRPQHLEFIRNQRCLICGDNTSTEAAHVRFSCASMGVFNSRGIKPDDALTNPLCSRHHREQHAHPKGEADWWRRRGIDPHKSALGFWLHTGNFEKADKIVDYHVGMSTINIQDRAAREIDHDSKQKWRYIR